MSIEVDIWVRGTLDARTCQIEVLPSDPNQWHDGDVRTLLSEMLLALERHKNPDGDPPSVRLRGFSWIVSPYESGGVLIHIEMQMGTASAGPLAIDEKRLTAMVVQAIAADDSPPRVH